VAITTVLIQNTATAVAELATAAGATSYRSATSEAYGALSVRVLALGHDPRHVPLTVARATLSHRNCAIRSRLISFRRRLQMLWFGQRQSRVLTSQVSHPTAYEGWLRCSRLGRSKLKRLFHRS